MFITTAGMPKSKRFAFWKEVVCETFFKVDTVELDDRPFSAQIRTTRVKDVTFAHVRCGPYTVFRSPLEIRQAESEAVSITSPMRGNCLITQDGREARLAPGDLACIDSTRPYFSTNTEDDNELIVIRVPREIWAKRVSQSEPFTARTLSGNTAMGMLVSNYLRQTVVALGEVEGEAAQRLCEVAITLVTAAIGELIPRQEAHRSTNRIALLYRSKAFIEDHLHDPELNVEKIAAELRISVRYLHDLFHEEDISVSSWIWTRRLEKSSRALLDPLLAGRNVSQIAFDCGFNDFAHFSRRFKAAFAMTPSEFRREKASRT